MSVFISMGLSVLIWSLYPLVAAKGISTMNSPELVAVSSLFAIVSITIFSFIRLIQTNKFSTFLKQHKALNLKSYGAIFGSGVTHLLCHGLFFAALAVSHKGGASLIYESWPIIAIIATPLFIKKQWREVSLNEILVALLALIGVVIVIISNEEIELPFTTTKRHTEETDYMSLFGYIFAFVGAYACAMNVIFKAVVMQKFETALQAPDAVMISEFYSRLIGFILILGIYPFFSQYFNFTAINWGASIFIGVVVMVIGGALYTYALMKTKRPTIHIIYYFVPILAVLWLWLAGETTINIGLFIGGIIITFCNIYLYFAGRRAKLSEAL